MRKPTEKHVLRVKPKHVTYNVSRVSNNVSDSKVVTRPQGLPRVMPATLRDLHLGALAHAPQ